MRLLMNKQEFSRYISENFECSDLAANAVIEIFTESVNLAISEGRSIALDNLGTFAVKYKPAKEKYLRRTGKKISIAGKVTPCFKASDNFKTACAS